MNPNAVTPESAVRLPSSLALDVFVFDYVLGGLIDPSQQAGAAVQIPSFSRKWADCHMLLIKLMVENRESRFAVRLGDEYYDMAARAGHVASERPVSVWRLSLDDVAAKSETAAYGRKFEEALCKLAILMETQRRKDMIS